MRRRERELTHTGRAVRADAPRVLEVDDVELVGDVLRERKAGPDHRGVLLDVLEVLGQREADALGDAAVHLAVNYGLVDDLAHVGHRSETLDRRLAGLGVHRDFRHEDAVHVRRERCALAIAVATGVDGGVAPLSGVLGVDALGDHFVVGAELAVGLPHG